MVKDGLAEKASTLGSGVTKLPFNFFHIIYVRQDSQLSPKGSSVGKRLREYLRMELAAVPGSVKGKGVVRIGKGVRLQLFSHWEDLLLDVSAISLAGM